MQLKYHKLINKCFWLILIALAASIHSLGAKECLAYSNSIKKIDFVGVKNNYVTFDMHLIIDEQSVEGWYCYHGGLDTIQLLGSLIDHKMVLSEWIDDQEVAYFQGEYLGMTFEGIWYSDGIGEDWPVSFYGKSLDVNLPTFKPTFYTFKTKFSLTGLWNIYTDHIRQLNGTFISDDGEMCTIRLLETDHIHQIYHIALIDEMFQTKLKAKIDFNNRTISNADFSFELLNIREEVYGAVAIDNNRYQLQYITTVPEIDMHSSTIVFFRDTSCVIKMEDKWNAELRGGTYRFSIFNTYFISKKYLSGVFNIISNGRNQNCKSEYVINWDLSKRKPIDLNEGLLNEEVWRSELIDHISVFLEDKQSQNSSGSIWNSVKPEDFNLSVMSSDDMIMVRPYDKVFGQLTYKVPKALIMRHFSSRSFIYKHVIK